MTELLKSPLNYIGNKYKILPQLLPLFPKNIDVFVDLFCGGLDVSINIDAGMKYCNDIEPHLIGLLKFFQSCNDGDTAHKQVMELVDKYQLSKTNKIGYLALREDYNNDPSYIKLFTLLCHGFNNQLRFNSKGYFNTYFGKREYSPSLQKRLLDFIERITDKYIFTDYDFTKFDFDKCNLTSESFVYIDPPYLISEALYNQGNGWTKTDDLNLMYMIDRLNAKGIKFGMSNVIKNKGDINEDLINWSKKYSTYVIDKDYSHCCCFHKDKNTQEVFICNY